MKKRYENPPILDGYKHVEGKWYNGFVIERCTDGSQFVWVPVGCLDDDGTLDGKHFNEKFGRRKYLKDIFSNTEYNEPLTEELLAQKESVEKYGGFYISRYNISKSADGKPQTVKDCMPWVNINYENAQQVSADFEHNEVVKSHLIFGAEYDSALAWLIKSGVVTLEEVVTKTSVHSQGSTNNICNFVNDTIVDIWTQEKNARFGRVVRGGSCYSVKGDCIAKRDYFYPSSCFSDTGFRVVLYIK